MCLPHEDAGGNHIFDNTAICHEGITFRIPSQRQATLENMYVTANIFGMEQHQEQWKNNRLIVFRQLTWHKPLA